MGIIPGNIDNNSYVSYQGLTYGGLVTSSRIDTKEIIEVFCLLNNELKLINIKDVIYIPVHFIYHSIPAL